MLGAIVPMIIIFGILFGANYYISQRMYQGIASVCPKVPFGVILAVLLTLTVLMVLDFAGSKLFVSPRIKNVLGIISAYWMGIFIYLLIFTTVADVFAVVSRWCKLSFVCHSAYRGISLVVVVVLTLTTVLYGAYNARQIKHISYEIPLVDKQDVSDLNIVMISDLHLGAVGSEARLENIVNEINSLNPDVVCIAGDFFDSDYGAIKDAETAIKTLNNISATYGTYACLGNHDAGKTTSDMQDFLKKCNIQALNDEYVVIDERLILIGRLDASPIGGYGDMSRRELSEFFVREDNSLPVVVMDHNPANIGTYTNEADLILSGHTHKGQLFPANIITNLMYEVDHGYYRKNDNNPHVVVTSGIGYWSMPMRVGSDSEIVSIQFVF